MDGVVIVCVYAGRRYWSMYQHGVRSVVADASWHEQAFLVGCRYCDCIDRSWLQNDQDHGCHDEEMICTRLLCTVPRDG